VRADGGVKQEENMSAKKLRERTDDDGLDHVTARPRAIADDFASGEAEVGLSIEPEEMGEWALRAAAQEDVTITGRGHDPLSLTDSAPSDEALPGPNFNSPDGIWGQSIDATLQAGGVDGTRGDPQIEDADDDEDELDDDDDDDEAPSIDFRSNRVREASLYDEPAGSDDDTIEPNVRTEDLVSIEEEGTFDDDVIAAESVSDELALGNETSERTPREPKPKRAPKKRKRAVPKTRDGGALALVPATANEPDETPAPKPKSAAKKKASPPKAAAVSKAKAKTSAGTTTQRRGAAKKKANAKSSTTTQRRSAAKTKTKATTPKRRGAAKSPAKKKTARAKPVRKTAKRKR
jgi:hypothetical protein